MENILIIGLGKVGSSLFRALSETQACSISAVEINAFSDSDKTYLDSNSVFKSVNPEIIAKAELIIICLPDDNILDFALSLNTFDLNDKIIVHTSGLQQSAILNALQEKGAQIGSLHPLQSFAQRFSNPETWQNIYCSFEGSQIAANKLEKLCKSIGANFIQLDAQQKKALHLAAVFSSNYLVALFAAAEKILNNFNLDKNMLFPLITNVMKNFTNHSASAVLTGPLQRGDVSTVKEHQQLMNEEVFQNEQELYQQLAHYILKQNDFEVKNREELLKLLNNL